MPTIKGEIVEIKKIKRCYIDCEVIDVECPDCGVLMHLSFADQYLMYPQVGTVDDHYLLCEGCDKEWKLPITIESAIMTLEYDPKELEEV